MRCLVIIGMIVWTAFLSPVNPKMTAAWVIEKNSTMNIAGSSNINAFTCDLNEYLSQDTLQYVRNEKSRTLVFQNSVLNVNINRFDCHNKFITSDFRKTLRADKNLWLHVKFISLEDLVIGGIVKGIVEIEIAGQTKRMDINYSVQQYGNNQLQLIGSKTMDFSDFKLTPPKKLGGLIRINEEIKVNFHLHFRKIA